MNKLLALALTLMFASTASAASGEAVVRAVWWAQGAGGPSGGTSPITVRVQENHTGRLVLGIGEEYLGGAGDQWRGSVWLAAFNASQVAGVPLGAHEFFAISGGHIDGPSAGMLMTATMLALLTGVPVRADSTMTGTVNPDGSAGPVGGIPLKMLGAKEAGIKRFGFPMGNRYSTDPRTGKKVDLVRLGKRIGVEAVEVHDLWEAYELLTGRQLPRVTPLPRNTMGLPTSLVSKLKPRVKAWERSTTEAIDALNKELSRLPAKVQHDLRPFLSEMTEELNHGLRLSRGGYFATGLERLIVGWTIARVALMSARFSKHTLAGDAQAIVDLVVKERRAVTRELDLLAADATRRRPGRSVDGAVNASSAFADWARANAFVSLAEEHFQAGTKESKSTGTVRLDELGAALTQLAAARGMIALGRERLGLFTVRKGAKPSLERLRQLARAYGSMGNAALGYVDVLSLADEAKSKGVQLSVVQQGVAKRVIEYRVGRETAALARGAGHAARSAPSVGLAIIELGAGTEAYLESAALVNKFYSLGGSKDASGAWRLKEQASLKHQLDMAQRRALESAARAKATTGQVPVSARWYFELGEADRAGDDEDKLNALNAYWTSSLLSEMTVSLTSR